MDVLSLTPATSGHCKALVLLDHFSRNAWAVPIADETQDTIARAFIDTILIPHGAPEKILTDRGAPFMAALNKSLYKQCNIRELHTSPMHPQTNSLMERFNRTLCNILASYVNDRHSDWPEYLQAATAAYNHAVQASTRETPYFLFHMRDPIALDAVGTHVPTEAFLSAEMTSEPRSSANASRCQEARRRQRDATTRATREPAASPAARHAVHGRRISAPPHAQLVRRTHSQAGSRVARTVPHRRGH